MLLHDRQEPDNDLRRRTDEDLVHQTRNARELPLLNKTSNQTSWVGPGRSSSRA